jgi:hypothetical protein
MNLQSFINYRNICPLCSSELTLCFHSKKKQKHEIDQDRFIVKFEMGSITKNNLTYVVGYSFSLHDDSVLIEFYNKQGIKIENITLDLLKKFNEFNTNLGIYTFYKYCSKCNNYNYTSNIFLLDRSIHNVNIFLRREYFCFFSPWKETYKRYQLVNDYEYDISFLGCFDSDFIGDTRYKSSDSDMMKLNLIKFVSKEETFTRIKKLILFS